MAKSKKRGRKPGVKVGPYKMSLSEISSKLKEFEKRLVKVEKAIG